MAEANRPSRVRDPPAVLSEVLRRSRWPAEPQPELIWGWRLGTTLPPFSLPMGRKGRELGRRVSGGALNAEGAGRSLEEPNSGEGLRRGSALPPAKPLSRQEEPSSVPLVGTKARSGAPQMPLPDLPRWGRLERWGGGGSAAGKAKEEPPALKPSAPASWPGLAAAATAGCALGVAAAPSPRQASAAGQSGTQTAAGGGWLPCPESGRLREEKAGPPPRPPRSTRGRRQAWEADGATHRSCGAGRRACRAAEAERRKEERLPRAL